MLELVEKANRERAAAQYATLLSEMDTELQKLQLQLNTSVQAIHFRASGFFICLLCLFACLVCCFACFGLLQSYISMMQGHT